MAEHIFTEGEKRCLEEYWRECSKTPRKNLRQYRIIRQEQILRKIGF